MRPDCQRQGIGQSLVRAGLEEMKRRGANGCFLVGSADYYGRFGFRMSENCSLPGVPSEVFLSLTLAGVDPAGAVAFQPAFMIRREDASAG